MPKTTDDRILAALEAIEEAAGPQARQWVEARLPANTAAWSDHLSLGNRGPFKRAAETRRRNLVRGVLLAYLAADISVLRLEFTKEALNKEDVAELTTRLKKFLPSTQIVGNFSARQSWDPGQFTNPTNHNSAGPFMYIITGVVKAPVKIAARGFMAGPDEAADFAKSLLRFPPDVLHVTSTGNDKTKKETLHILPAKRYLADPNLLRFDIISTSLIDTTHVATYFPWGFILRVPPANIISALYRDQGVKNRPPNVIHELQTIHKSKGLATPQEVLAATTGANGDVGYNEVVVIGSAPERTQVDVTGIFVKVDPNGNLFIRNRPGENDAYVSDLIPEIQACSRLHNIPIVKIIDPSSKPSTTPWPF